MSEQATNEEQRPVRYGDLDDDDVGVLSAPCAIAAILMDARTAGRVHVR